MRRELFGHPGGEGLALQPAERARAPRAHGYWYPDGGAEPTDASDGSPYIPNEIAADLNVAAGALAGDVPSLARGARPARGSDPGPAVARGDDAVPFRRVLARLRPGAREELRRGHRPLGPEGNGHGTHTDLWHAPRERITVAMSWNDGGSTLTRRFCARSCPRLWDWLGTPTALVGFRAMIFTTKAEYGVRLLIQLGRQGTGIRSR